MTNWALDEEDDDEAEEPDDAEAGLSDPAPELHPS